MTIFQVILVWSALASLVAFVLTWKDKRAARREAWRVSERTLHLVDLVGGWPGGIVARHLFRHKTRKRSFRLVSAAIVTLHLLIWTFVLVRSV